MESVMNQQYHIVFNKGRVTVRRPWKGKDVEKYSSSGVAAKDGKPEVPAMFGSHEMRQFLEPLGEFILVTIEDKQPGIASQLLSEGYTVVDPDDQHKSKWYVAGYYVRDESVVYIMTPTKMNDAEFFKHRGLKVDLENEWGNSFKVGKYMKRLYSHHRKFMQGQVIGEDGPVIHVRLDSGRILSVKYADHGKLTDGMSLISTHCMKMMGLTQKVGQGMRITALSPKGFSKGHAIVLPDLQYDLVLFNSKKMLFGEKFTFGVDWLHDGGAVYTDVQSYVNFRFVDHKYLREWSTIYMNTVIDAIGDTEKLRKMLQFYVLKTHMEKDADGDLAFVNKDKDWTLLNALRHGVDIQQHPALVRRYFNLFTKTIMNCETNMRTPIDSSVGGARYAIVDPSIFDMWGDPTLEGELRGNTVYCDDKVGEVAFHRQPNGHRNEHHIAQTVQSQHLKNIDTGCFMFMSKDMIVGALETLGGGDQDDRLVYYTDQSVVDHFKNLELDPYPVVKTSEVVIPARKPNVFEHRKIRTPRYDRDQLLVMLDQMKEQGISIGYVVNAVMQDTCITDHKQLIMKDIVNRLPVTPKHVEALAWTTAYPGYVLRDTASHLEDFIDAVKKTGSNKKGSGNEVRDFNRTYLVVPEFFTRGGRYGGRVPQSRRDDGSPVVVRCPIDDEIDEVLSTRKDLEDIITDNCYQMMKPVPEEILTYPTVDPVSEQLALAIKASYHIQWDNLKKEDPIIAYKKIDESLHKQYGSHPLILDAMVWLYKKVYEKRKPEAPRDAETGQLKKFPDGILWGTYMSVHTIKMLELVGLAGRFIPVEFYKDSNQFKYKDVDVSIRDGVVKQSGTNEVLGIVDPMADGTTMLTKGYAFVKPNSQDVYPYEGPEPKWISLSVVNGWNSKQHTPQDLAKWRAQEQKQVVLVPYLFIDATTREEEHAVRVMLDGQEYGHITRRDAIYVTEVKQGWLAPNTTGGPQSMAVIVME
jgi:hypothetical protein